MKPSFAQAPRSMNPPTRRARMEARATACCGSPPAAMSGRIVAAIIGPRAESGPRTRIRDGPKTA